MTTEVASPCINICKLEKEVCIGCFRTLDEIASWTTYTDVEKKMVIELSNIRREQNFKGTMSDNTESFLTDKYFLQDAVTEEKFMWTPRRCNLSNKLLWMTFAIRGHRRLLGPGGLRNEYRFYHPEDFIMMRLKDGC